MRKEFYFLCLLIFFTSCQSLYKITYDIGLNSVESPINKDVQPEDNQIEKITVEGEQTYRFEDDNMVIVWAVRTSELEFSLKNKSGHTMKLDWDDVSYVNDEGSVSRVMHKGIKYNEREKTQASINIPNKAFISDVIIPTDNVWFFSGYKNILAPKWEKSPLIPCYYNNKSAMQNDLDKGVWLGKTIRVLLPIEVEGIRYDYSFEFKINDIMSVDKIS